MSAPQAPDAARRVRVGHRQSFGRLALGRRDDQRLQPAGDAADRADRRARQVRPVLHLRRPGDGSGRSSVVRQPLRAADAALRAQHGDAPYRSRCDGVDELQRPVHGRARLRLARPHQRRTRRPGTSSPARTTSPRSISAASKLADHDQRYEVANEFVDVVRGPVGHLGGRRHRRRPRDRCFPRCLEGAPARSQGTLLPGQRSAQRERPPQGHPLHHPGRRLGAGAGAVRPHRRSRVLGGQRRQGIRQGRLRQL